jgi:hypothetical protein
VSVKETNDDPKCREPNGANGIDRNGDDRHCVEVRLPTGAVPLPTGLGGSEI